MREYRQKVVNVGCMGKFNINYYLDGDWEIIHNSNRDGNDYIATEEGGNLFFNMNDTSIVASVEDWMWNAFMDDLKALRIEVEHDSIHTPYTVGTA